MFPAVDDLLPIAQVLKSYGTQGELLISFLAAMPDDIDLNEPVFLIPEGLPVPFFIEEIQFRGTSKALVRFQDIDSMKEAEQIVGQKLYLPAETATATSPTLSWDIPCSTRTVKKWGSSPRYTISPEIYAWR